MGLMHGFVLREDLELDFSGIRDTSQVRVPAISANAIPSGGGAPYPSEGVALKAASYPARSLLGLDGSLSTHVWFRHTVTDPFDLTVIADTLEFLPLAELDWNGRKPQSSYWAEVPLGDVSLYSVGQDQAEGDDYTYEVGVLHSRRYSFPGVVPGPHATSRVIRNSHSLEVGRRAIRLRPSLRAGGPLYPDGMDVGNPAFCATWAAQRARDARGEATVIDREIERLIARANIKSEIADGLTLIAPEGESKGDASTR